MISEPRAEAKRAIFTGRYFGTANMAFVVKAGQISRSVNNVTKLLTNLSLSSNSSPVSRPLYKQRIPSLRCALFHTTSGRNGLMEFFDDEKNWIETRVQVGRSWRRDELRLKSNQDLHKLWFVLLKERNMLLTMGHAYDQANLPMPSPERIDKVEESMFNLEQVVRERNKAYHLLETGETGERPVHIQNNAIGIRFAYKLRQYSIPKFMNTRWYKNHFFGYKGHAVHKFLRLYREKLHNIRRKERNRERNRVSVLLRKFPQLDIEALQEQYPTVDIRKARESRKSDGHYVPE